MTPSTEEDLVAPGGTVLPDGNSAIREHVASIVSIIASSAQWVHPDTFRALPVWAPWAARGRQLYDKAWSRKYLNTSKRTGATVEKAEGNVEAKKTLLRALDVASPAPKNWTVCHIWGYDDEAFAAQGNVVRDARFFTCVANMVWLPTPLKGFTDAMPEVKEVLRVCAFHLYGWVCEHDDVRTTAGRIRAGEVPAIYPAAWPTANNPHLRPPGTAPFTPRVRAAVEARKAKIRALMTDPALPFFPREEVQRVLDFWKVQL